jgi:hypothetical protein
MLFGKWLETGLRTHSSAECRMQSAEKVLHSAFLTLHLDGAVAQLVER